MAVQQEISMQLNQQKVGQDFKVLIDRKEGEYYVGRTEFDSPDVDNEVLIKVDSETYLRIGDFTDVNIYEASDFDLYGKVK
jgi:ribosomal protein S12 methylthiotransferase